ncbi:ArsR/SmtB family transcription factor [Pseudomonas sp. N040]|uniref:ArsR/SmtB family transcription factor n=1 Tax=Pseudomonas sp. N040 TaxID=2785325 RepID=UPI0018A268B6|nr:metalloregulator ArsR/SmtB family transcription factor [Pseudomonas sp. N040]MBF7730048.1 helix-turn-helix transcriptional regulator [Pseudomonas sp. N040]MBW7013690.1 metalloregulator ArsR/SmtB family transcription factor [Pseudomonas sp. N040]
MQTATLELDSQRLRAAAGDAGQLLKALANPDRLLLLCQLAQGERSVGELEALLGILQPTLSQQLAVLRREGLVDTRREGKQIFYRISSPQALAVINTLYQLFCGSSGA